MCMVVRLCLLRLWSVILAFPLNKQIMFGSCLTFTIWYVLEANILRIGFCFGESPLVGSLVVSKSLTQLYLA